MKGRTRRNLSKDIDKIMRSGLLMNGPFAEKFENLMTEQTKRRYAVSVNSCTTALTICLKYFGVENHDVLVPSASFLTSVSSIIFAGGNPVFVDINPGTLSFDIDDLYRKLTRNTKGIVWVHLTGVISPEYKSIVEFAKRKGLFLIEDAAQALGAEVKGKPAGSLGDAGCFSFYPTKIITTGTGGMIVTGDKRLKRYGEAMRLFGKDPRKGKVRYLGNDWFMDEIRACLGCHYMDELKEQLKRRRLLAGKYNDLLCERRLPIETIKLPPGNLPSYYQFPVFVKNRRIREIVISNLKTRHLVQAKGIYTPCHKESVFRQYYRGGLARTEEALCRALCLPLHVSMSYRDVSSVVRSLKKELKRVL